MKGCFLAILCILLILPVSASIIYVNQGDTVYPGETVDLRGVYGWECTVAWWPSDVSDTASPSKVEEVCYPNEIVNITLEQFPVGNWYKWDGKTLGSRANDLAFKVADGKRPAEKVDIRGLTNVTIITVPPTPTTQPTLFVPATPPEPNVTQTWVTLTPSAVFSNITTTKATKVPTRTVIYTPMPVVVTTTPVPGFVFPNLPPIPVIILLVVVLYFVVRWWNAGAI